MKNIVICCDGTWQKFGQPNPTNVALMARVVGRSDAQGVAQVVRYDDGVGVGQGGFGLSARLLGGAFGDGLDYKIARSYEFLCLNYQPGDRIYLFGFSRGAYTVRSLAGLLRQLWILRPDQAGRVADAMKLYRRRPRTKANSPAVDRWIAEVQAFHRSWCHPVSEALFSKDFQFPRDGQAAASGASGWIQYLGVWDTVGSLGLPLNLPFAELFAGRYAFHDMRLSRIVGWARHAVALDEARLSFAPSLWENLPDLNDAAGAHSAPYADRPYQQQWFPGGHASVGGGAEAPISRAALLWIAEGAARAGLGLDPAQIAGHIAEVDPTQPFAAESFSLGGLLLKLPGVQVRKGPEDADQISLSARRRAQLLPAYRPRALTAPTLDALKQLAPPDPIMWFRP